MQNKGLFRLLSILIAVICLYQLSFSLVTSRVEKRAAKQADVPENYTLAKELAGDDENAIGYYVDSIRNARENKYLDSISNQVVYNILIDKYTYREAKEREINLGLDLKGGMNVMLEVSVKDIINALSGYSKDPVFNQALEKASIDHMNSQEDFVDLFGKAFEEADPNAKLAPIFLYEFKDKGITVNSSNDDVLKAIKEESSSAVDRSFQILRTRIDRFGVAQPNIQKLEGSGRILIELPGIKDPKRVRKLLQGTAQLEFWETYNFNEVYQYFDEANKKLADINKAKKAEQPVEETTVVENQETEEGESELIGKLGDTDSTEMALEEARKRYAEEMPLYALLSPSIYIEGGQQRVAETARMGMALVKDTADINRMLATVKSVFPRDMKLVWTVKPSKLDNNQEFLELVALKASRENKAALGGEVIVDARADYGQTGNPEVSIQMNSEGAKAWKRLTGDNIGRQVAIVLDDYVYSYPVVNDEIGGGRSSISGGSMTVEEAQDLANILKAGKLPAPARILEENVVGPSLGKEAVQSGLWSFILAFVLVLIYMAVFYNKGGLVADIALLVNVFFLFGVLASLGAVLTLPGIAGIVLTLGMAVDANVIIYERIKEEIMNGKGLRLAIEDGYKNAYSAILDGQITTFLTGLVLYVFGTGPVQGFATTLMIGICTSLFTAIFISRLVFVRLLEKNKSISFTTKITQGWLKNTKFNFISFRKTAYIIAGCFLVVCFVSLGVRGLNLGIDFKGGRNYVIRFDKDVEVTEVRKALASVDKFNEANEIPEVKTFGPDRQVKVTTKYRINEDGSEVDQEIQELLYNGLKPFYNQDLSYEEFTTDSQKSNVNIGILSSQKVGATIADDVTRKAVWAVIISLVVIFVYIAIRFRKWQFGVSSVIALTHDTILVLGMYSLLYNFLPFSMEVDQSFIAAILTVIGYSINNTVVVFDRIRENMTLHPKAKLIDNINSAVNSTLLRSINTSGTTLVVLLAIFIFGGETIRGFIFAMLVGILAGTFSSLFVASPLAYNLFGGKKADEKVEK